MNEQAFTFECEGDTMLGVVSPTSATVSGAALSDLGVIIIVGGPQYRAGSHRQFVSLARSLAEQGVLAMRFDTRGMGDSSGAQRTLEHIEADLGAAIDALQASQPQIRRIVFWGLCGGASAALLYWSQSRDPRVCGLILVNPWVRSAQTLARTTVKHYYLQRLSQRTFWTKLLRGGVAAKAVNELVRNLRLASLGNSSGGSSNSRGTLERPAANDRDTAPPLPVRMAAGWHDYSGPTLLILSENDYTAKEFLETALVNSLLRKTMSRSNVTRFDVAGADHTFSDRRTQTLVEEQTFVWLQRSLAN